MVKTWPWHWPLNGQNMVLEWFQNLNTQGTYPLYQFESVSKFFRILTSWKENIG